MYVNVAFSPNWDALSLMHSVLIQFLVLKICFLAAQSGSPFLCDVVQSFIDAALNRAQFLYFLRVH